MAIFLSADQQSLVDLPFASRIFLHGRAGTGKTTAASERLIAMIEHGVPAQDILVLTPQRSIAEPYAHKLHDMAVPAGSLVSLMTIGGLAKRSIELFWPLVSANSGFAHPDRPPHFLTMETAQYYMSKLVAPMIEAGRFSAVTVAPSRIFSQLLDDLNKASVMGFSYAEIGERLRATWNGKEEQINIFKDVQDSVDEFRRYCLENNLLDFSLQMELFTNCLWRTPEYRAYLMGSFRHLVFDNIEEDTPVAHDIVSSMASDFESVLMVYDDEAGYRSFLGSDPVSAAELAHSCNTLVKFEKNFVVPETLDLLTVHLGAALNRPQAIEALDKLPSLELPEAMVYPEAPIRYFPQMVGWAADQIVKLVTSGVRPDEIAVLSPFLNDSLRFALSARLKEYGISYRSYRPSRSLMDEPEVSCMLTLAEIAYPDWSKKAPLAHDVVYAFSRAIKGLDLVRARLMFDELYRPAGETFTLEPFEAMNVLKQPRIPAEIGVRYNQLREWLLGYAARSDKKDLDFFFASLFGDVLTCEGFGFENDFEAARIVADLMESVRKFRWAMDESFVADGRLYGGEYLDMLRAGTISAQYVQDWASQNGQNAVTLAPAHTFLMWNRPVKYQFWLSIGSSGWVERLYQPLTHPYVLSRRWPLGQRWTDADEFEKDLESLYRLVIGLTRRCTGKIYVSFSEFGEQGYEERGALLRSLQKILRQVNKGSGEPVGEH